MKFGPRTHFILLILCALFVFTQSSFSFAEEPPTDVLQAAEQGLEKLVDYLEETYLEYPMQVKRYGFDGTATLSQAVLGEPFQVYGIRDSSLENSTGDLTVSSISEFTGIWTFPVMIGAEYKTMIDIGHHKGEWKPIMIGKAPLAKELSNMRNTWNKEKGYTPRLIMTESDGLFYFTIPQIDSTNLTMINLSTEELIEANYETLSDANSILHKAQ